MDDAAVPLKGTSQSSKSSMDLGKNCSSWGTKDPKLDVEPASSPDAERALAFDL